MISPSGGVGVIIQAGAFGFAFSIEWTLSNQALDVVVLTR
jgi:hypothetical protein